MCLLRKIAYGEFSEFVREKKITYRHIKYETLTNSTTLKFGILNLDCIIVDTNFVKICDAMMTYQNSYYNILQK